MQPTILDITWNIFTSIESFVNSLSGSAWSYLAQMFLSFWCIRRCTALWPSVNIVNCNVKHVKILSSKVITSFHSNHSASLGSYIFFTIRTYVLEHTEEEQKNLPSPPSKPHSVCSLEERGPTSRLTRSLSEMEISSPSSNSHTTGKCKANEAQLGTTWAGEEVMVRFLMTIWCPKDRVSHCMGLVCICNGFRDL